MLWGVDLEISSGELVVHLGASGSGKPTLLNILDGLDRATAHFFDQELNDRNLWRIKGQAIVIALGVMTGGLGNSLVHRRKHIDQIYLQKLMHNQRFSASRYESFECVGALEETKQAYYEHYRLADIFCTSQARAEPI